MVLTNLQCISHKNCPHYNFKISHILVVIHIRKFYNCNYAIFKYCSPHFVLIFFIVAYCRRFRMLITQHLNKNFDVKQNHGKCCTLCFWGFIHYIPHCNSLLSCYNYLSMNSGIFGRIWYKFIAQFFWTLKVHRPFRRMSRTKEAGETGDFMAHVRYVPKSFRNSKLNPATLWSHFASV